MVNKYYPNIWDERANQNVEFSSVIAPDDKLGLKAEYINIVDKRIIEKEIYKFTNGSTILDFCCGIGRLSQWNIFKNYKYTGIDQSVKMIEVAERYFGANKNLSFVSY